MSILGKIEFQHRQRIVELERELAKLREGEAGDAADQWLAQQQEQPK